MQHFTIICAECGAEAVRLALHKPKFCDSCKANRQAVYQRRRYPTALPPVVEVAPGLRRCLTCDVDKPLEDYALDRGRPRRHCRACQMAKRDAARSSRDRSEEYAQRNAKRSEKPSLPPDPMKARRLERARRNKKIYAKLDAYFTAKLKADRQAKMIEVKPWLDPYLSKSEKFSLRYRSDPEFRVKELLRQSMRRKRRGRELVIAKTFRRAIRLDTRASSSVEEFLGYTAQDLRSHLGSLFADGMSWDAFMRGEIHIDHIRPVSSFDLADDEQIKECWSLANLQPLWAADNMRKGAKWVCSAANDNGSSNRIAA